MIYNFVFNKFIDKLVCVEKWNRIGSILRFIENFMYVKFDGSWFNESVEVLIMC